MLPVLLLRGRQNVVDHEQRELAEKRARIENLWLRRPVWTAAVTLALCVAAATQLHKLYFDYNLLHMQSEGLPAVVYEEDLIHSADKSVLFGAVTATNLEQAVALEQQLTNLPAVAEVTSIAGRLHEDQSGKLGLVNDIKRELATVHFTEPDSMPVDLQELSAVLFSLRGYLGAALEVVQKDAPELVSPFNSMRDAIEALRKEMLRGDTNQVAANALKLAAYQQSLFDDVRDTDRKSVV